MSSVNKVLVSLLQLAVIAFARECVLDSDCEQSQQFGRIQAIQVDFFLFGFFVANILWFAKTMWKCVIFQTILVRLGYNKKTSS